MAPPDHGTAAGIEWLRAQHDKSHFKLWVGGVGLATTLAVWCHSSTASAIPSRPGSGLLNVPPSRSCTTSQHGQAEEREANRAHAVTESLHSAELEQQQARTDPF